MKLTENEKEFLVCLQRLISNDVYEKEPKAIGGSTFQNSMIKNEMYEIAEFIYNLFKEHKTSEVVHKQLTKKRVNDRKCKYDK